MFRGKYWLVNPLEWYSLMMEVIIFWSIACSRLSLFQLFQLSYYLGWLFLLEFYSLMMAVFTFWSRFSSSYLPSFFFRIFHCDFHSGQLCELLILKISAIWWFVLNVYSIVILYLTIRVNLRLWITDLTFQISVLLFFIDLNFI